MPGPGGPSGVMPGSVIIPPGMAGGMGGPPLILSKQGPKLHPQQQQFLAHHQQQQQQIHQMQANNNPSQMFMRPTFNQNGPVGNNIGPLAFLEKTTNNIDLGDSRRWRGRGRGRGRGNRGGGGGGGGGQRSREDRSPGNNFMHDGGGSPRMNSNDFHLN